MNFSGETGLMPRSFICFCLGSARILKRIMGFVRKKINPNRGNRLAMFNAKTAKLKSGSIPAITLTMDLTTIKLSGAGRGWCVLFYIGDNEDSI
jgi:hypothetical protein